jgi:hypothetical protein
VSAQQDLESKVAKLEKRLNELEEEAGKARDYQEIWNLMGRRQHLLQNNQNSMLADQFPPKDIPGEEFRFEIADLGPIVGLENVKVHYRSQGDGNMVGFMGCHLITTPVIVIAPDRKKARLVCFTFGPSSLTGTAYPMDQQGKINAVWCLGKYNIECIKVDGKWYFQRFCWHVIFRTPYDQGWIKQPISHSYTFALGKEGYIPDGHTNWYRPYNIDAKNYFLPWPPDDDYYTSKTKFDDLTLVYPPGKPMK